MSMDSPHNKPEMSELQSNYINLLLDNNFSNLKVHSNVNLKSPLSPTMDNIASENDYVQSKVLETNEITVTNVCASVKKKENKVIKNSKNKVNNFINKCFPKITKPSAKSSESLDDAHDSLEWSFNMNQSMPKVASISPDKHNAIKNSHCTQCLSK